MSLANPSPLANLDVSGQRFAIVAARFNQDIVDKLIQGAQEALKGSKVADSDIETFRVAGSLEIPGVARRLAQSGRFAGVICIGVVIKGDTIHFDLVAHHAVAGIARLADEGKWAVANCIIACDHEQQAWDRAGGKVGNKGFEAAQVALEVAALYKQLAQ